MMIRLPHFSPGRVRRNLLGLSFASLLLGACNGIEIHPVNIQTAASGTQVEARQVVALVYGQAPLGEIDGLLYAGGDLSQAIKRSYQRFSQLRPHFERGEIGNTASGFVALRDQSKREALRQLICDENNDRAFLYTQSSVAVGHGDDTLSRWLPYASSSFGREWIAQAPKGWWQLDAQGVWSAS